MARLTLGDRISAAAVGTVFGAAIGLAAAWLVGVYSSTLGASVATVDFKAWVGLSAAGFALVGLLFGPFVGTLLGNVISGMFELERASASSELGIPTWLTVVLCLGLAGGLVWWLSA